MNIFREQGFSAAACDGKTFWVSDNANGCVLAANCGGTLLSQRMAVNAPTGIAVYGGEIFVADKLLNLIHVFTDDGRMLKRELGGPGILQQPVGIAVNEHYVYVADSCNHRIAVLDKQTGTVVRSLGKGFGHSEHHMNNPMGVALHKDLVVVADYGNSRVLVYRDSQPLLAAHGFPYAYDVTVSEEGTVYVALAVHCCVRKLRVWEAQGNYGFTLHDESIHVDAYPVCLFIHQNKLHVVTKKNVQTKNLF